MPGEEEAHKYFEVFFDKIHPYIPVIHRDDFYRQWEADKTKIPSLLLEAIFACAGMASHDQTKGMRWLTLANRHESTFLEAPRLSTIQALLLLLKAREAVPKNGYYYRSWQLVKTIVCMAKDLGLHEHHNYHKDGEPCGMEPVDCLVATRVWQTLVIVEVLIGAPQGLNDFAVDVETVDIGTTWNVSGLDAYEMERSRQYAYLVQNALNMRRFIDTHKQSKRQSDGLKDPRFTANNNALDELIANLPADLQVVFPTEGSSPWLSSHFMGNLNVHFHLSVILQHRSQLTTASDGSRPTSWRTHMTRCYSSAKAIYHLQDAIISTSGLTSLSYMQRGIHFTVYCILTCLMVHSAVLSSSDVELYSDAAVYFSRHMRLLEQCTKKWSLPDIQAQLDIVRATLSVDTTKPFELKSLATQGIPEQSLASKPLQLHIDVPGNKSVLEHSASTVNGLCTSSPPMVFEMLSSCTDIDPQFVTYLDDGINWDPTRLVTQWDLELSSRSLSPASPESVVTPNRNAIDHIFPIQFDSTPGSPFQKEALYCTYDFEQSLMTTVDQKWDGEISGIYTSEGLKRKWEGTDTFLEEPLATQRV
ncbi:predicted protein [Uncinocarpus reesii 1704]|uniref:Xylanolytic transcriptional activator regulatory domain-containing protein n=1 Tax=Uncinocarpus reesii (strain UAMH 1704) TaxID=336963 RepID=C4JI44_UNCRE|nr:uncharacterized protein UREG_01469 [Uncinocarpus reesii 1704]EEP76620.1 predicted protein [Uncinocarpus reesii 1704]